MMRAFDAHSWTALPLSPQESGGSLASGILSLRRLLIVRHPHKKGRESQLPALSVLFFSDAHHCAFTRRNNLGLASKAAGTSTVISSTGVALLDVGATAGVNACQSPLRVADHS